MALEFQGAATPLCEADFQRAADRLACEVAAIKAVAQIESGGRSGFLSDKRPLILFESRWFHKLTNAAHDKSHPDISTPKWVRNYDGGAGEYDRLARAVALDRAAAFRSTSWGMFQILGINHAPAGFACVETFVDAACACEGAHLDAFVSFVVTNRLDDELRDRRWDDFARAYNGPGYRQNRYAKKMAAA
ncbi:MAG: N-acetylmuramidase family protein, partial [Alphaproteobacteria bacterium]|nr:N-acetylmuramidase family protein [Alphaproteobacteria bacterium]